MASLNVRPVKGVLDLVYVSDDKPGWTRQPSGKGFSYHREDGSRIKDELVISRLDTLAIPPAWTGVWICPLENGHLLSTGRDAAGRKQYRYHPGWPTDLRVLERVAEYLGNTVAVCRKYYVHPAVLQAILQGEVPAADTVGEAEAAAMAGEFDPEEITAFRACSG